MVDTLLFVKNDPHRDTLDLVSTKALINMLPVSLEKVKPKHLTTNWVI